jgi:hypothetical protein
MASMPAVQSVPGQAVPPTSNSDPSATASDATDIRNSIPPSTRTSVNTPMPTTASAAEVSNPEHPHHRHHRNIQDFELTDTLGEGSYSTVCMHIPFRRFSARSQHPIDPYLHCLS